MSFGMRSAQDKVTHFRELLKKNQLDVFIIPSEDAHQSEYVAECDQRRHFISGFTGSAGVALVTQKEALLWTDGRYFLQAEKELDAKIWKLMRVSVDKSLEEWIIDCFMKEDSSDEVKRIGLDGRYISIAACERLEKAIQESDCSERASLVLLSVEEDNLVDIVWGSEKPPLPKRPIFLHALSYAASVFSNEVNEKIINAMDRIAWLFNLRGSDVEYNPVFLSYAVVTLQEAYLFVDHQCLEKEAFQFLMDKVMVRPYESIFGVLKEMVNGQVVWLDKNKANMALYQVCQTSKCKKIEKSACPIALFKAIKNDTEIEGAKNAHIRDAAALITYFGWLEKVVNEHEEPSECEGADVLDGLRAKQELFVSLSFPTISSIGSNAAIIHYRPEPNTCKRINSQNIYLCDSGGQYRDGTTDVTRTLHFGYPSARQVECYTRVLKSHIQMDCAIFPKGTSGMALDCLTRAPLWKVGLDYRHGTGHGVGSFLNVHEGPQSISFRPSASEVPLEPNMLVTDEPGYYEDGAFGIRIENVLLVKSIETPNQFGGKPYYGFEHLTFVPMESKLIDTKLLTEEELEWLNNYHEECWKKVSPHLKEPFALQWLEKKTRRLSRLK
eukprot:jgi/Galph1/4173/GphlegSOOS_G2806.1